jgi:hypothetical protein
MNHAAKTARYTETVSDQETLDTLRLLGGLQPQFEPVPAQTHAPTGEPSAEESAPEESAEAWSIRFSSVREHPAEILHRLPLAMIPAEDWQQLRQLRDNLWDAQENNPDDGAPFSLIGLTGLNTAAERWAVTSGLWASHWEWSGCRVLLIDADPTNAPSQQTAELADTPGFVDVAARRATLSNALQRIQGTQLYLMGPGNPDSDYLDPIDFRAIRPLFAELRRHFDFVFLHLPNHEGASDLRGWARSIDGTLVSCRRNYDTYRDLENLLGRLPPQKTLGWLVV